MWGNLKMVKDMGKANKFGKTIRFMKATGQTIEPMAKDG
jgi:hypothetical protein